MKAVLALLLIALLVICAQSRRAPGYNGPAVRPRWPKLYAKRLPAVEADEEDEEESEFWTALIPVAVNLVKSKLAKKRDSVEEESDFINWKKVWGVAKDIGKTYLSNKYGINLDEAEEEADLKLGKFFKKAWGVAKDIGKNYLSTKYGINLDEEDEEEADQNRAFDFGANVNGRNWNVNAGLTGQTRNGGSYNVGGTVGNGGQWGVNGGFSGQTRNGGSYNIGGNIGNGGNWGVNGGYQRSWNNGNTNFGGNVGYGSGGFNAGIKFSHRFDDIEEEESDFINWKKVWGVAKDIGKTYLSSKYGINLDEAEEESDSEFIKINWKKIGNIAKDIGKTYLSSKYGINLDEEDEEESDSMDAGSNAAAWASQQVGKGYSQSNRLGPNSFDCSGLIYTAYRNQGISVPSYTGAYPGNLKRVYGEGNLRAGDILYRPGHVAMYVGGGQLVQAANPRKGVVRTSLSDYNKYWGGYTAIYRP